MPRKPVSELVVPLRMLGTSQGTSVLLEQCKSYESKSFDIEGQGR